MTTTTPIWTPAWGASHYSAVGRIVCFAGRYETHWRWPDGRLEIERHRQVPNRQRWWRWREEDAGE